MNIKADRSKYTGGFTQPNYLIKATLGMKAVQNQIVRNEGAVKLALGTPQGVTTWVNENQPFVSLQVIDINGMDVTSDYTRDIHFVKSRYGGGESFVDMRQL
jgi:hypothetical protein